MKYRKSIHRERILSLLRNSHTHPTVDWIYHQLKPLFPSLSLGTVYRNVNILVFQGMIQRVTTESGVDCFEPNIHPHYHFICENCGMVSDMDIPIETKLEQLVQPNTEFIIKRHRVDFYGICPQCYQKQRKENWLGIRGIEIVGMEVKSLIDPLNRACADEWLAHYQYWVEGLRLLNAPWKKQWLLSFLQHTSEELHHVGMPSAGIIQLGGVPLTTTMKSFKRTNQFLKKQL